MTRACATDTPLPRAAQTLQVLPIEMPPRDDSVGATPPATGGTRWLPYAVWAFVALGVFIRLARYLLNFPLWCDEAYVAANFLDRGYEELLAPLDFGQVGPPLFLWIELTAVKLLGYSEWSLRLFPLVCGVGSVFLFRHVAARLLSGVALLAAVGIFAVSYAPVRHAVEVKPYASDLFVALVLLALALKWRSEPRRTRWLWALTAAMPFAVVLSYPAVFVAGGVSLAVFADLWKCGQRRPWLAWTAYTAALVLSFAALFLGVGRAQYDNSVASAATTDFWASRFPPLTEPLRLAVWMLEQHTGRMFGYPVGGDHGGSAVVFACCAAAVVVLRRRRRSTVLVLLLAPFALNLVAAALHRYPYGGSARVTQHLAPMICILAGLGAAALLARLRDPAHRRAASGALAVSLAIFGGGQMLRDIVHPYKQLYDQELRDFVRFLGREKANDAVLACMSRDLHLEFAATALRTSGAAQAQYLCNQAIYAPRRNNPNVERELALVSAQRPLRCVMFGRADRSHRETASAWLAEMQQRFDWVGYEKHDFRSYYLRREGGKERIEIFEFVPKGQAETAGVAWRVRTAQDPQPHATTR
jgi:hypothetical protein